MNIVQALDDPTVFRGVIRDRSTWGAWRGFLKTLFGLPMDDTEAESFRACTGRTTLPTEAFAAAWLVCGRRGGKSFALALIAVFKACFVDYRPYLATGERAIVVIVAADRRQSRVIFRYVVGILRAVPALSALIEGETAEELRLVRQVNIEVMTASSRTIRGYAIPVALLDEAAFWSVEGATDADTDIIGALRPAMKQFPGAMMLGASSPYARRGALWEAYRRHFGKDDSRTLVWQAATRVMNPTIPPSEIDAEYEADPVRAAAEYGALFRSDIESFVAREVVDAAVQIGRHELPPSSATRYVAFTDPSGGSADAMTLAIAHVDRDERAILDAVRVRKPPFSPESVTEDFAAVLKTYGVHKVTGDRYAGEWPRERFRVHGIAYDLSDRPKSDIYRDVLPILNSGKVELLDHSKLIAELCGLERRTARGGRDSIDHAPNTHDDVANAVAGAITLAATDARTGRVIVSTINCGYSPPTIGSRIPKDAARVMTPNGWIRASAGPQRLA